MDQQDKQDRQVQGGRSKTQTPRFAAHCWPVGCFCWQRRAAGFPAQAFTISRTLNTQEKYTPCNLRPNPTAQETMLLRRALQGKSQQGGNLDVSLDNFSNNSLRPEASEIRAAFSAWAALARRVYQRHLVISITSLLPAWLPWWGSLGCFSPLTSQKTDLIALSSISIVDLNEWSWLAVGSASDMFFVPFLATFFCRKIVFYL